LVLKSIEIKIYQFNSFITNPLNNLSKHYADSLMPILCNYAVGASRLAYLSKPVWCLNQQPVDLTMTEIEESSANTDLKDVAIFMFFSTPSTFSLWEDKFEQFACESP
jgi:hypothetical protein